MLAEAIPHLSLGTAALIIFLICAAFVIIRGITRVLIGTLILSFSAWIGFLIWQYAPTLSVAWFGKSMGFMTTGLPIASFIVAFIAMRYGVKFLTRPLGDDKKGDSKRKPLTKTRVAITLVFTLLPACILFIVVTAMLHHAGTVAELNHFADQEKEESTYSKFTRNFKTSIDEILPEPLVHALDPLAEKSRVTLAKVITTQSKPKLALIVDPETNEPIPRAIIVENAEVHHLVEEHQFGILLRHPIISKTLQKPGVQEFIRDLKL